MRTLFLMCSVEISTLTTAHLVCVWQFSIFCYIIISFFSSTYRCFSVCEDDTLEQNHCLFEEYRDPCRAGPGKEKPWVIGAYHFKPLDCSKYCIHARQMMTIHWVFHWFPSKGTLLEQPTLYDEGVNTPENLQRYAQFLFLKSRLHSITNASLSLCTEADL